MEFWRLTLILALFFPSLPVWPRMGVSLVAPHFGCEVPQQFDECRGIVEEAVFRCIGCLCFLISLWRACREI
jgi:hypothetical protein